MDSQPQREGMVVAPEQRLDDEQIKLVDGVSRELLADPGLICFNARATELFRAAGATVEGEPRGARVRLSDDLIDRALESAPSRIVLGARKPENRLILDATEPRVRFVSGSETNIWLDVQFDGDGRPRYERLPGSIERLGQAAHLCDNLEHLDAFIRCVNIRDEAVTASNKDVNKFLVSANNMSKHIMAGLTDVGQIDNVVKLAGIIAGGEEAARTQPPFSFITCVIKSPFQVVEDTADTLMAICERGLPIVISSCPMGGATGPFDEFGMVAQINAELLAGVTLTQLVNPGAPVLYGAVPVRTRLDNLNDMYGAPEFVHYNIDCAQMARHYNLPCYSTAGVGDTDVPGIQATVEKLMAYLTVPASGAQYIHYAFGLLERTNVFCPEQAVMDNAHIGIAKNILDVARNNVSADNRDATIAMIREVMESDHKTYVYNLPLPTQDRELYAHYPLEHEHGALYAAHRRYRELLEQPRDTLDAGIQKEIAEHVPGVLAESLK
jgi:trimethylamine--corrinoid protein Co-methyltransferase